MYDMIVVGGGPAGMTAALYALRNGKQVLVIEKSGFGGQITHSPKVENYPGTLQMSGNEFADQMLDQILAQGAEIEFEAVVSVETAASAAAETAETAEAAAETTAAENRKTFIVRTEEGGAYEGRTVVLATGVKHRMLGLEGENELVGEGISFCAVCDGDFYSGQTVCVAGGGNSALQEAILLAQKCKEVIMLQDLPYFTGEEKLQEVLFACPNVRAYTGVKITGFEKTGDTFCGVEIEKAANSANGADPAEAADPAETTDAAGTVEKQVIPCDGLFVAIGLIPENEAFAELAALNTYGYFDSDERCLTKTPGIYVAGDCRSKEIRQLTTAAADGAVAALAACRYLNAG
ncbi:MAG: FAD-dependent oxidoreductase [Eubacterium sp.]|nr:FAD-dependent oxidoreductase [Eubacterium sp.]